MNVPLNAVALIQTSSAVALNFALCLGDPWISHSTFSFSSKQLFALHFGQDSCGYTSVSHSKHASMDCVVTSLNVHYVCWEALPQSHSQVFKDVSLLFSYKHPSICSKCACYIKWGAALQSFITKSRLFCSTWFLKVRIAGVKDCLEIPYSSL